MTALNRKAFAGTVVLWAIVALGIQFAVVILSPALPSQLNLEIPGKGGGGAPLDIGAGTLIQFFWFATAAVEVIAIATAIGLLRNTRWSIVAVVLFCALVPALWTVYLANVLSYVTGSATNVRADTTLVWTMFIIGFILGFGSLFVIARWVDRVVGTEAEPSL
ncbi:MAG: hypothetical protein ABJA94_04640 [Rhodoglobus sp.]